MPSLAATAWAVVRLSPVSITMRIPSERRLARSHGGRAGDVKVREQLRIAHGHLPSIHPAGHALASDGCKVGDLWHRHATLFCRGDDGSGQRVLARSLEARAQRQDRGFVKSLGRYDGNDAWLA